MKKMILFTIMVLAVAASLHGRKTKLAVMEIIDQKEIFEPSVLRDATEYLRSKLVASGKFIVIAKERQDFKKVKMMKKESYKQCYDRSCQIPLGQSLAADTIVTGKITSFMGRYTLTIELIDLAKEASIGGASANFQRREDLIQAMDTVIAKLTKVEEKQQRDDTVSVVIRTTPAQTKILMDGEDVCSFTPCSLRVEKGTHQFRLEKDGHRTITDEKTIEQNETFTWKMKQSPARITVADLPKTAELLVAGKAVAPDMDGNYTLASGTHKLTMRHPCREDFTTSVNAVPGTMTEVFYKGKQKTTGLTVTPVTPDGDTTEGTLFIGKKKIGKLPETYNVSSCAKQVTVKTGAGTFTEGISLAGKNNLSVNVTVDMPKKQEKKPEQSEKSVAEKKQPAPVKKNLPDTASAQQQPAPVQQEPEEIDIEVTFPFMWIGIGIAAAGTALAVGGGLGFNAAAQKEYDEYEKMMTHAATQAAMDAGISEEQYITEADNHLAIGDDMVLARNISYISGGILAAGGLVFAFIPKRVKPENADVSMFFDGDTMYVSCGFSF